MFNIKVTQENQIILEHKWATIPTIQDIWNMFKDHNVFKHKIEIHNSIMLLRDNFSAVKVELDSGLVISKTYNEI